MEKKTGKPVISIKKPNIVLGADVQAVEKIKVTPSGNFFARKQAAAENRTIGSSSFTSRKIGSLSFLRSDQLRLLSMTSAAMNSGKSEGEAARDHYKMADFNQMANHIAWRVAHFIDEGRMGGQRSFSDLKDYLEKTGITVMRLDVETKDSGRKPMLCFGDNTLSGFALSSQQICPQVSLEVMEDYFNEKIPQTDYLLDSLMPEIVPEIEGPSRPSWFYTPSKEDRDYRGGVLDASMSVGGLLGKFRPEGLEHLENPYSAFFGTQLLSRKYENGRWIEAPYSKTYRKTEIDDVLERETNTKASLYTLCSVGAETLEDYLDRIYANGGCTIHGKHVFLDADFIGRRIIKPKITTYNSMGKYGEPITLPKHVKEQFEAIFPDKNSGDVLIDMVTLPTILPTKTRVFAIDVDGLEVPEGWNIYESEAQALEFIRSKLPEPLKDVRMTVHFTSSFCFRKEEDGRYVFTETPDQISCRLWFVADEPMELSEFGDYVTHHVEKADPAIYSPNQPIYGDPSFIGMDDPLDGKRRLTVEGHPVFKARILKEEVKKIHADMEADSLMSLTASADISSARDGAFRYDVEIDPSLEGIERSRALVEQKLQSLGNRQEMASHAKSPQEANRLRNHFGFIRNVIVGHLYAVYRDFPDMPPMTMTDLTFSARDDALGEEAQFLLSSIGKTFRRAALDPTKETDVARCQEYGVLDQGVLPQGKLATLLLDANLEISQKVRANFQSMRQAVLSHARQNMALPRDLYMDYISKFTYPTVLEPSRHSMKAEAFTGAQVLVSPDGVMIRDSALTPSHQVATFSGEDRFHWVGISDPAKTPDFWKEGSVDTILSDLQAGKEASNIVFCHNCTLEEVRSALPKRPEPRSAFGSKSIARISLQTPILPKEIKTPPKRADMEKEKATVPSIKRPKLDALKALTEKIAKPKPSEEFTKAKKKGNLDI